jgi:hypothetical protein
LATGALDSCPGDCGCPVSTESEHDESVLIAATAAKPATTERITIMRTCSLSQHAL